MVDKIFNDLNYMYDVMFECLFIVLYGWLLIWDREELWILFGGGGRGVD